VSSATTTAKTLVSALEGDDTLSLILTYSRDVVVDTDGGTPYISIAAATGNVQAAYNPASSTSTQLQFDYSIDHTTDLDLDGLSLASASIQLNGATILDKISAGSATLTIGSVTNLSSVYIAPYAIVWFKGSTTNRSGFTTKPTITTTATLSSGYFNFNGTTDTMTLSSPMAATYFLYMAMKTPASGDTFPQRIMDDNLFDFTNDTIDFNSSRTVNLTTSTGFTGTGSTGYTSAFAPNTNTQVEATFPSGALVGTSPLISAEFSGDIAEIIIFEAVLSAGQASAAYDYINSAYP
jgi:hypothetical protein